MRVSLDHSPQSPCCQDTEGSGIELLPIPSSAACPPQWAATASQVEILGVLLDSSLPLTPHP